MPELLLELFSEEIPARMQSRAAQDLRSEVTVREVPLVGCREPKRLFGGGPPGGHGALPPFSLVGASHGAGILHQAVERYIHIARKLRFVNG